MPPHPAVEWIFVMKHALLLFLLPVLFLLSPRSDVLAEDAPSEEKAPVTAPDETPDAPKPKRSLATFAGGCFWCTEAIYDRIEGVDRVVSGYSGGHVKNPTYRQVTAGTSGHAECIQIRYDPKKVSYLDLLKVFFATHDPTTKNRQGADVGTQYRSAILWHDESQKKTAERLKKALDEAKAYPRPIVTEIVKFEAFYPADEHHQAYFERNAAQGYCRVVIQPKVKKFEKAFARLLKEEKGEEKTPDPAAESR